MRLLVLVAALAFAVDQASKWAVVHALDLKTRLDLDVFPPFLVFRMGWNRGVNFGLLGHDAEIVRWGLIMLALAICAFVARWAIREGGTLVLIGGGLLIGGALGNVLDRVIYGAVADFLNMSCCGIRNPYSFNVADIFVFAGAAVLLLGSGRSKTP